MNTETLTVLPKGEDFEIIVQHDQTGSAYGITLSKNSYEQLRQHFVVGRSEQLKAFADYAQIRMWEDGCKDLSEFVDEFLRL